MKVSYFRSTVQCMSNEYLVLINKARRNRGRRGSGCWDAGAPQIFDKVDFLPIGNDSEKKKIAKKI